MAYPGFVKRQKGQRLVKSVIPDFLFVRDPLGRGPTPLYDEFGKPTSFLGELVGEFSGYTSGGRPCIYNSVIVSGQGMLVPAYQRQVVSGQFSDWNICQNLTYYPR